MTAEDIHERLSIRYEHRPSVTWRVYSDGTVGRVILVDEAGRRHTALIDALMDVDTACDELEARR